MTDTVQYEQWKTPDGRVLEVRPIARKGRARDLTMLRVRQVGKTEWHTWHPDYLREQATKVKS